MEIENQPSNRPIIQGLPQTGPDDLWNRELVQQVRPLDWVNPKPAKSYHLVVIGGGTSGLVTAAAAAGLGARVALIEKSLLGGDCLNVGCVPSKGIIAAARAARSMRWTSNFGVTVKGEVQVDFATAMAQMRERRATISRHDSARRFRELGVGVFFGHASFLDHQTIEIENRTLKFARAVIATGSRPIVPPIDGLSDVPFYTNETIFSLTELPHRLAVIGGGPIGCELAQAMAQLGSRVVLIDAGQQLLSRDDPDAVAVVLAAMKRDGVEVLTGHQVHRVEKKDGIVVTIGSTHDDQQLPFSRTVSAILLAVGRVPNIEGIGLERAGVQVNKTGIQVDQRLRTTNPRIFASGDVCSPYKFTHAADFLARHAVQNALFWGRKKTDKLVIPYCTYTTPELAAVGLNEATAAEQGVAVDVYRMDFDDVDRAVLERNTDGFVKVLTRKGTDRIVGATIVGPHAGDLIGEITIAMTHRLGLAKIGSTIHPYPTHGEAIRKLGDRFNKTRLTRTVKWALSKWLSWLR